VKHLLFIMDEAVGSRNSGESWMDFFRLGVEFC
jgi:hypothetical protein